MWIVKCMACEEKKCSWLLCFYNNKSVEKERDRRLQLVKPKSRSQRAKTKLQKKVFGLQNNFRNNIIIFVVYLSVALSICPQKKRGNEKYNNNHIAAASQEKCKQPKCSRVIKLYGSRSIFPQRILSSLFLNDNDKKKK